ncbi:hypothetical protein [Nonomuraea dietziae]|uniref:hypothetical protein n=1 Tax=Nonomuraea dietziae TaxID=65515 RepID=UPI0033EE6271
MRHVTGAVIGLAALPFVYYLTEAGAAGLRSGYALQQPDPVGPAGLGAAVAVSGALACAPRLSPLAALVCGLPLTLLGLLFAAAPESAARAVGALPAMDLLAGAALGSGTAEPPGLLPGVTGLYLVIGGLLVLSALPPSRWRPPGAAPPQVTTPRG